MTSARAKQLVYSAVRNFGGLLPRRRASQPEPTSVHRILVVMLHGLGDVFYASTMLPLLKRRFPDADIDVWVHSRTESLLKYNPLVHRRIVFDGIVTRRDTEHYAFNAPDQLRFVRQLRSTEYDIILDCSWLPGTAMMLRGASPRWLVGGSQHGLGFVYDVEVPYQEIIHTPLKDLYPHILRRTGLVPDAPSDIRPVMVVGTDSTLRAHEFLQSLDAGSPLVTIHVSAGWSAKEWGIDRYAQLINEVRRECGATVAVIGNGARDRQLRDMLFQTGTEFVDALGLPIDVLAAVLPSVACHIGADSFPLHLAASLNVPSVGIFGPTNPAYAVPPGTSVQILYHQLACSSLPTERHCTRNAGRTCPLIECLLSVTVEEVLGMVKEALAQRKGAIDG